MPTRRAASLRSLIAGLLALTTLALSPASSQTTALEGIPAYDHIAIIVLENENFDESWGPGSVATYLNSLRDVGVFAEQYYATGHLSLTNYIALISGQPANPLSGLDCLPANLWLCVQPQSLYAGGRNLADQLEETGHTWKGYMDSMPEPCFHADYSPTALPPDPYQGDSQQEPAKDYADRHNPFIYFDDIVGNDERCKAHVRPYAELTADLAAGALPSFSFITPDTCHDGHDAPCSNGAPGGLISADAWLSAEVPDLLAYMNSHNGLLIITFDENGFTDLNGIGCCTGGPLGLPGFGGRIGLVGVGAGVTPGKVVSTKYDHMSLLRTIEDSFGISEYLNNARSARPMSDLFG